MLLIDKNSAFQFAVNKILDTFKSHLVINGIGAVGGHVQDCGVMIHAHFAIVINTGGERHVVS
jgi:hypothetical protein